MPLDLRIWGPTEVGTVSKYQAQRGLKCEAHPSILLLTLSPRLTPASFFRQEGPETEMSFVASLQSC